MCSSLRGRKVEVWWEDDSDFYPGKVVDQDFEDYTFQILCENEQSRRVARGGSGRERESGREIG